MSIAEVLATSAVSVPVCVDRTVAVVGDEHVTCHAYEGGLLTSSEVVPGLAEGKLQTVLIEGTMTLEEVGRVKYYATQGALSTSSDRVPALVDGHGT